MVPALNRPGLRIVPVLADNMEPRLRRGRDFVMVAEGSGYQWAGLYAIDGGDGPVLYRCERRVGGMVAMTSDNPAYSTTHLVAATEFARTCLGMVAAELTVLAPDLIREAYAQHHQPQEIAA